MIKRPSTKKVVQGASDLSLGISIITAILIGVGVGYLLRQLTGIGWLFWLGVFWGIAAAVLNVYKAYRQQFKSYEALKDDPKYAYKYRQDDDDDELV